MRPRCKPTGNLTGSLKGFALTTNSINPLILRQLGERRRSAAEKVSSLTTLQLGIAVFSSARTRTLVSSIPDTGEIKIVREETDAPRKQAVGATQIAYQEH